jgi:hypothetical protein
MSPYRRKTPPEATQALDQLNEVLDHFRRRSAELARELAEQIHACLHAGATWGEVGERLGMTKQGARDHWGPYIQGMMDERITSSAPPAGPARVRRALRGRDPSAGADEAKDEDEPPP